MRVSISWLKHYLSGSLSDAKIVDALERSGIEVEEYLPAKALHAKLVVAVVKKVLPHPNAERLRLAKVSDGKVTYSVVCGAPNLAEGQKVILAKVGAVLPDGETIREASLRGEVSQGMICSQQELDLGSDHSGILVLPDDTVVGQAAAKLFPAESVLDIKTPFNRFDALTVIGLAREVAAFTGASLKLPEPAEVSVENGPKVDVDVDPKIVGRFMVAELAVKNDGPGLPQQSWLEASGLRSISPVVDITNFVLMEYGQPLHAYDADKVKGYLRVRWAKAGEKLVTLDGVERKLIAKDLVIADSAGAVGLAGVMGGQRTETTAKTKRILLESATFDAATVRKMAQRHNLRSEASARFERGLPVQLAPVGLASAIALMKAHKVATKVTGTTDELRVWPWIQRIGLRRSHLNAVLGVELSFDEAVSALNKLGIPAERFDIAKEAKKHLGKPYVWGASYKKNGTDAFDCSYLTDYLYSLIGQRIGYTSLAQYEIGQSVDEADLRPGDILFYSGRPSEARDYSLEDIQTKSSAKQPHSAVGSYFLWDDRQSGYVKREAKTKKLVGHNGLYIGDGKVIHAAHYKYVNDEWQELVKPQVEIVNVEAYTSNPTYLGARRYVDDLNDWISVPEAPWWRPDLKIEEDLIEEIIRVIGYDRLPVTLPAWQPKELVFDRRTPRLWQLKNLLSGLGLFEVMTYSFISEEQMERGDQGERSQHLKLKNPMSTEQAYLRRSALPSLLTAASKNDRYSSEFGMYELTRVFVPGTDHKQLPEEPYRLTVLVKGQGEVYPRVKGVLDALARVWGLDLELRVNAKNPVFLPGRRADILLGRKTVGLISELAPELVELERIHGRLACIELQIDPLLDAAKDPQPELPNRFPSISRDLNLVLKRSTTWAEVEQAIISTSLAKPEFLNDYYPDNLAPEEKNLAVRLAMSDPEKTLTDAEADKRVKELLAHLRQKLGLTQA